MSKCNCISNGWINCIVKLNWLKTCFIPNIEPLKKNCLFLDGHSSNIELDFDEEEKINNIEIQQTTIQQNNNKSLEYINENNTNNLNAQEPMEFSQSITTFSCFLEYTIDENSDNFIASQDPLISKPNCF